MGYITNHATKGDCSQYQRVMRSALARKDIQEAAKGNVFDSENKADLHFSHSSPLLRPEDKFCLKAFNRLAYDRENKRSLYWWMVHEK